MMHWETIIVAVIAAIPGLAAAILTFLNRSKLTEIHLTMNSRLDKLLTSERSLGHAEGVAVGKASKSRKTK